MNAPSRPKQITVNAIEKHLDRRGQLTRKTTELPLTVKALSEVVETGEQFAVRRVKWATQCFLQENINPAPSQLLSRANVYKRRNLPEVKEALKFAREILETLDATNGWKREAEYSIK